MKQEERAARIETYGTAYQQLISALEQFPREMWQYRPAPDRWTIHEIIVHITDSEANSYVRCRRFLAEPDSAILGYDENRWARELRYEEQSADDALELFRLLRKTSYVLISDLPETVWSNLAYHSENGPMTLDDWLEVYARHVSDHVEQMRAVYEMWVDQNLG